MTPTHLRQSIERLNQRLETLRKFDPTSVQDRFHSPELTSLRVSIEDALERTFGRGTTDYNRYSAAAYFNTGPINMSGFGREMPIQRAHGYLEQSKQQNIAVLQQAIESLSERLQELEDVAPKPSSPAEPVELSKRVFIVHGHDKEAKEAVARVLHVIGLEPIILHEQPNMGRTIIEKFEAEGKVGFAIVLLTPDDVGKAKMDDTLRPRARQNVIMELGYFVGSLRRSKVCALVRGDIELPSDFAGVVYERYDDEGRWKLVLGRELAAAGYKFDAAKLFSL